jgi:hypothetical protein
VEIRCAVWRHPDFGSDRQATPLVRTSRYLCIRCLTSPKPSTPSPPRPGLNRTLSSSKSTHKHVESISTPTHRRKKAPRALPLVLDCAFLSAQANILALALQPSDTIALPKNPPVANTALKSPWVLFPIGYSPVVTPCLVSTSHYLWPMRTKRLLICGAHLKMLEIAEFSTRNRWHACEFCAPVGTAGLESIDIEWSRRSGSTFFTLGV